MATISIPRCPVFVPLRRAAPHATEGQERSGPVRLESNGYVIRSLRPDDATPAFLAWFSSPQMLAGLNIDDQKFTPQRLRDFIASFDNYRNYFLGIFYQDMIVGFYTIDVNLTHRVGMLTTGIGERDHLGKGTLWATIDVLLDYFYAHRDVEKFVARILARNWAMLFNFKDNPRFVLEAHLKRECRTPDGRRVDLLIFASHKEDGLGEPVAAAAPPL
jgi:RimJ/RimL family protein N-acetyltransferase